MCGISGLISKNNINIDSFAQMNQIIKHRGPDDEGFVFFNDNDFIVLGSSDTALESWSSNELYSPKTDIQATTFEAHIGFGHRRLSILDLSARGHQPMCTKDEHYWITFNGEIYNYVELRVQLQKLGHVFHTESDTEVILLAYKQWGVECQDKFNGMWAFALYDSLNQTVFLSRDRFGIKPLYYWFSPSGDFYFGSEIKQFTVLPGWKAVLNHERALDYLQSSLTDHTDETMFKGVFSILPGHHVFMLVSDVLKHDRKIKSNNWYKPEQMRFQGSFIEAKGIFLKKFIDAVSLHLRADVSIGSALSGGIDSSSIVCIINQLLKEQGQVGLQKTFSSCSVDKRFDERVWMEEVVHSIQVDANYIYPKGEEVFNLAEKLVWQMDEPYQSQSAFLGYHVFKEAKNQNVKVLLNGQGADEYLSGYGAFRVLRLKKMLHRFMLKKVYVELRSKKQFIRLLASAVIDALPKQVVLFVKQLKKDDVLKKIINYKLFNIGRNGHHSYKEQRHFDVVEVSKNQLFSDPLPRYLRWEDRNSMVHSIEARVPFLDHRLVEFAHSLPLAYLDAFNESKRILVEAMDGILPEKVRKRLDKMGFITPEEKWLKHDFKENYLEMLKKYHPYSNDLINFEAATNYLLQLQSDKLPFSYTYWRLICFCVWMKVYQVEIQ